MKRRYALIAVVGLLALVPASRSAEPDAFFFKPNDRVMFLGDSITEQYQYSSYIELYLTTRFPKANMTFLNAGIGGDTANGGADRFPSHVLAEKPTALTINFGMNDGGYGGFDANRNKQYVEKTEAMMEMSKKAGVRVALISPNAVQTFGAKNAGRKTYLETQKQFYAPLKEIAGRFQQNYVDQYAVTREALEKIAKDDPEAKKVNPFDDGVHTTGQGGLLMAHTILVGLHAPALVSEATIDAKAGQGTGKKCTLEKVTANDGGVVFDRMDEALAMPVFKNWAPILPYVNDLKDLNYYGLKVTGLASGKYALSIDGKEVGSWTADDLANGVNLGTLSTGPIFEQGEKVFNLMNEKNDGVHKRFREVVMFNIPEWLADVGTERRAAELAKRMDKAVAQQEAIYKEVQPKSHHFELKVVK
jgi:lysophospholipase L1-like esterase